MEEKQYFEWISDKAFEDSIHNKFGYGVTATMKLATGDTSMTFGEEYIKSMSHTLPSGITIPSIQGLDALFTIDVEDDDEDYGDLEATELC